MTSTLQEKQGYKKTKLGWIPEDWEVKCLDEVTTFNNGKAHEQSIVEKNGYIVVNSKFISTNGRVYKFSSDNISPLLKDDITLVMSDIPKGKAFAKCFLVDKDDKYTLNQRICSLKTKDGNNSKYLFYTINRNSYFLGFDNGVSQTNLRKDEVLKCPLRVPPLPEQQKIAEILSTVDEKIDCIGEQIEKTQELKKGLMQKLLTQGIGHTKFKPSPLGSIPACWELKKLGCITSIIGGGTPRKETKEYWKDGTIYWATPTDFTKRKGNYISETDLLINEYGLKNSSATLLKPGTILMSSRATIGECKINTKLMTTNQGFASFECSEKVNNLFLLYLLKKSKQQLIKLSSGSTFLEISRTTLKGMVITLPPLEEQQEIAEILSTVDDKLETLQAKKSEYEQLKKGLMQKLLTGQIRVSV